MIQVKVIAPDKPNLNHPVALQNAINEFLQTDEIAEVVDIKYSSCMAINDGTPRWRHSAMIIYKTIK